MESAGPALVIKQLFIGTLVIAATVAIHAEMFGFLSRRHDRVMQFVRARFGRFANTSFIMTGVLYIMLVHTIEVWLWALVLMLTEGISGFEPALYFSLVSFTTLGYGDLIPVKEWRLLAGLIGANGFLLFGWSTAYMFELVRRTR